MQACVCQKDSTNGSPQQTRSFVNVVGMDARGRYVYNVNKALPDLDVRQSAGESQWAVRATARYEF